MEFFYEPLYENKEFSKAYEVLKENKSVYVPATTDSQRIHLSHAFGASFDVRFIITYDDIRAGEIYEESKMYDKDVVYFKGKDIAYAYKLGNIKVFDQPKSLADYGLKAAPQSFAYIY